jgi:hypothetical protein
MFRTTATSVLGLLILAATLPEYCLGAPTTPGPGPGGSQMYNGRWQLVLHRKRPARKQGG